MLCVMAAASLCKAWMMGRRSSIRVVTHTCVTGLQSNFECINGRAWAGNTPTIRAKVGQTVAMHAIGLDGFFHTFHIHGHRWRKDGDGPHVDCVTVGPGETISTRWTEDNPGRWLYHCHVFSHQDAGMAGWYIVE